MAGRWFNRDADDVRARADELLASKRPEDRELGRWLLEESAPFTERRGG
jgi:hypothetical protein